MAVRVRLMLSAVLLAWGAPAHAQADSAGEIDALVDQSNDPESAIALARRQMAGGDLVEAAATLERVLMDFPEADDALLLHASLLCRLDDRPGARAELAEYRGVAAADQAWAEVTSACGPMPRPGNGG